MKISVDELKSLYNSACSFEQDKDGYIRHMRYTKEQEAYFKKTSDFWYERCVAAASVPLEFTADAKELSFGYKITWEGSQDTFELCEDDIITDIRYVKDLPKEGTMKFKLLPGKHEVKIYLPTDAVVWIRDFEIDGSAEPLKHDTKILWLGDSISQGFGTFRSGETLVTIVNRRLKAEILNQSIGGYVYDKNVLTEIPGYTPDKIIIALGTNQFGTESMKDIEEYYEVLTKRYAGIPTLCITPLWRGDVENGEPTLISFCDKLKVIVSNYNIACIDGFKLVPHLPEYFLDKLHPNPCGAEVYAGNLLEGMRKIGF
ncbi:MAG: SGNH/GDSL hydrolase family protein [Clostridiales bacterium]|nr:SGNH/GDSL hydrolase family protein [Clostridiales bacterium]